MQLPPDWPVIDATTTGQQQTSSLFSILCDRKKFYIYSYTNHAIQNRKDRGVPVFVMYIAHVTPQSIFYLFTGTSHLSTRISTIEISPKSLFFFGTFPNNLKFNFYLQNVALSNTLDNGIICKGSLYFGEGAVYDRDVAIYDESPSFGTDPTDTIFDQIIQAERSKEIKIISFSQKPVINLKIRNDGHAFPLEFVLNGNRYYSIDSIPKQWDLNNTWAPTQHAFHFTLLNGWIVDVYQDLVSRLVKPTTLQIIITNDSAEYAFLDGSNSGQFQPRHKSGALVAVP